ncbi:MAG: hypothetical protein CMF43_05770 [Legionellales bacterium]|nr:hypothetical protein [Legionellales bacterium]|tara:strand:- start:591 stop:1133 length:543 start_codon:yes stop_codon:yes gene_type:complete
MLPKTLLVILASIILNQVICAEEYQDIIGRRTIVNGWDFRTFIDTANTVHSTLGIGYSSAWFSRYKVRLSIDQTPIIRWNDGDTERDSALGGSLEVADHRQTDKRGVSIRYLRITGVDDGNEIKSSYVTGVALFNDQYLSTHTFMGLSLGYNRIRKAPNGGIITNKNSIPAIGLRIGYLY